MRWARILRTLGHRIVIEQSYDGAACDVLVALHARRSHSSIRRFHRLHPENPLLVALTGTDIYRDISTSRIAQLSLARATLLIALQPMAAAALPQQYRKKVRVIYQSARPPKTRPARSKRVFEVCVIGHLRRVKDPFRAALAVRHLPDCSKIKVTHVGAALTERMATRARKEASTNPRYDWLGELPPWRARRVLARCRLMVLSSLMEGGANVISEALAAGVPIVSSRIAGAIGRLGRDYPGYFAPQNTRALAALLRRCETDKPFYRLLGSRCNRLKRYVDPRRELSTWKKLLAELQAVRRDFVTPTCFNSLRRRA